MSTLKAALWLCAALLAATATPASADNPRGDEPGSTCPPGYLCGQNAAGNIWLYSDLGVATPAPGEPGITWTRRVTSEQFPPPGVSPLTAPIGLITWHGAYLDDDSNGCTKAHHFRIEFYNDDGTGKPDCASPVATWSVTAVVAQVVGQVNFGGPIAADEYEFTVALPSAVSLPSGHFSITSDNIVPDCYLLLAPSGPPEGNGLTWRWYEDPTACNFYPAGGSTIDVRYCFSQITPGACCHDCVGGAAGCVETTEHLCNLQGGRFQPGVSCAALDPPCGAAPGACCRDDGSCEITTCLECLPAAQACCLPDDSCIDATPIDCTQRAGTPQGPGSTCATTHCGYRLGDLNCDGTYGYLSFGDINPFVLYLSNFAAWQVAYPDCPPENGDINGDGTFGHLSFGDINPFVALLSSAQPPIPCPTPCPPPSAPRQQGATWNGVGSTCDPNAPGYGCCTIPVPPGANQEGETANCTVDHYDGGCNSTPPVFKTIGPLPYVMYGESGTFDGLRDTDWYEYTSTTPLVFIVTLRAEFDPLLSILHAGTPDECADAWLAKEPIAGTRCADLHHTTRCLPAGQYWFVVAPNSLSGVSCAADYQLTVESAVCEPCTISCVPGHTEATPCNDDPNLPDQNAGCTADPNDTSCFEPISFTAGTPLVLCGTAWARDGARDQDWYSLVLTQRAAVAWQVDTEVPLRASLLFTDPGGGFFGPPTCGNRYFWSQTLYAPCVHGIWNRPELVYDPGTYWFLVQPEDANGPVLYGYACGFDAAYRIELVVASSPGEPCGPALAPNLQESEPSCGPGYIDNHNSGCDQTPVGPRLPIAVDPLGNLTHDYCAQSGVWLDDPNNAATLTRDYDWYEFTLAGPLAKRFSIYCYAEFPATIEIWPNNCTTEPGPAEGVQVPAQYTGNINVAQCYPPNTYWLRVYPTDDSPACGSRYYLALYNPTACTLCALNCAGSLDNDDSCGAPDTNAGCDETPFDPNHILTFALERTYCGRSYASAGDYDPDWFTLHLDATTDLRLGIRAEFPAHIALYRNCAEYAASEPPVGFKDVFAACAGPSAYTNLDIPALPAGDYVGVIYAIDQLGNLLTNYYPCAHFNGYQIQVTTY